MRYGIFADVHSNLEALQAVLDAYAQLSIDRLLCVGDIVGYNADPRYCLDIIQIKAIPMVAGNHDWLAIGRMDVRWFTDYAQAAGSWMEGQLTSAQQAFLQSLPLTFQEADCILVHATLHSPDTFHYMMKVPTVQKSFAQLSQSLCFIGHTHVPGYYVYPDVYFRYQQEGEIHLESTKRYIINVGSVGQPRDRDNRACCAVYDSEKHIVEIRRISYDIATTQRKIIEAGLPHFLAERLGAGR